MINDLATYHSDGLKIGDRGFCIFKMSSGKILCQTVRLEINPKIKSEFQDLPDMQENSAIWKAYGSTQKTFDRAEDVVEWVKTFLK